MFKADLTFRKLLHAPENNVCMSGHVIPEHAVIEWYHISGETLAKEREGVYCQLCVAIAMKHAAEVRRQREAQRESHIPAHHDCSVFEVQHGNFTATATKTKRNLALSTMASDIITDIIAESEKEPH
jgi:hypothetical protein